MEIQTRFQNLLSRESCAQVFKEASRRALNDPRVQNDAELYEAYFNEHLHELEIELAPVFESIKQRRQTNAQSNNNTFIAPSATPISTHNSLYDNDNDDDDNGHDEGHDEGEDQDEDKVFTGSVSDILIAGAAAFKDTLRTSMIDSCNTSFIRKHLSYSEVQNASDASLSKAYIMRCLDTPLLQPLFTEA